MHPLAIQWKVDPLKIRARPGATGSDSKLEKATYFLKQKLESPAFSSDKTAIHLDVEKNEREKWKRVR